MKKLLLIGGAFSMLVGVQMAQANLVTYNVVETFLEPETQPNNTIFTGSFTFDTVSKAVSNLSGSLTESMTGMMPPGPMTTVPLTHQLSAMSDAMGGLLVTTFLLLTTNTLSTMGGGNGWAPGSGFGLYYGFPGPNPGNAYAMIDINLSDPTAALTAAQINKRAYADCTVGGMMGATCITGTTVAGYGFTGTMGGYPISERITAAAVPEPETYALMMVGLGMIGLLARRRKTA